MCLAYQSGSGSFKFSEVVSQSELSKNQFDSLTFNGSLSTGGRSGNKLPQTATPNSYYITDNGHVIIYGNDGYRAMDISAERIKIEKYNVNPYNPSQGSWSSKKLKNDSGQVEKTAQWILDYFGIG